MTQGVNNVEGSRRKQQEDVFGVSVKSAKLAKRRYEATATSINSVAIGNTGVARRKCVTEKGVSVQSAACSPATAIHQRGCAVACCDAMRGDATQYGAA